MPGSTPTLAPHQTAQHHPSTQTPSPAPSTPIHVALVSAPVLVVAGLQTLLEPLGERLLVAPFQPGRRLDVGLFDPAHVRRSDLEALPTGCPTMALTWDDSPGSVHRARELGARRAISVAASVEELIAAIESVAALGQPTRRVPRTARTGPLTEREEDIMVRICRGMSNQEIADDLYLSINSVKTYVRTAYRKVGVTRRSQAVLWGLQQGY